MPVEGLGLIRIFLFTHLEQLIVLLCFWFTIASHSI